ncbi:hypothetical protein [Pseudoduganella sp. R-34]|uniref:hypothetical protein n=1 Tax=Pseudoduganella sp. R-34 TaxID=3404062 RepID=UPI003CF92C40
MATANIGPGIRSISDTIVPGWRYASYRRIGDADAGVPNDARQAEGEPLFILLSQQAGTSDAVITPEPQGRVRWETIGANLSALQEAYAYRRAVSEANDSDRQLSRRELRDWVLAADQSAAAQVTANAIAWAVPTEAIYRPLEAVGDALRRRAEAVRRLQQYYLENFDGHTLDEAGLRDRSFMRQWISLLERNPYLDYAQAELYDSTQRYFRDNRELQKSANASPEEVREYWLGVLGTGKPAERLRWDGAEDEWLATLSTGDLARLAVSMDDARQIGVMTALLQDRVDRTAKRVERRYGKWRKTLALEGAADPARGEFGMCQAQFMRSAGFDQGNCLPTSTMFAMAYKESQESGVLALSDAIAARTERNFAVTIQDIEFSGFRLALETVFSAVEFGEFQGRAVALDQVVDDMGVGAGSTAVLLMTGTHVMALMGRDGAGGKRQYLLFDPNLGAVAFSGEEALRDGLARHLARNQSTYAVEIGKDDGPVVDVLTLDDEMLARLSALEVGRSPDGTSTNLAEFMDRFTAPSRAASNAAKLQRDRVKDALRLARSMRALTAGQVSSLRGVEDMPRSLLLYLDRLARMEGGALLEILERSRLLETVRGSYATGRIFDALGRAMARNEVLPGDLLGYLQNVAPGTSYEGMPRLLGQLAARVSSAQAAQGILDVLDSEGDAPLRSGYTALLVRLRELSDAPEFRKQLSRLAARYAVQLTQEYVKPSAENVLSRADAIATLRERDVLSADDLAPPILYSAVKELKDKDRDVRRELDNAAARMGSLLDRLVAQMHPEHQEIVAVKLINSRRLGDASRADFGNRLLRRHDEVGRRPPYSARIEGWLAAKRLRAAPPPQPAGMIARRPAPLAPGPSLPRPDVADVEAIRLLMEASWESGQRVFATIQNLESERMLTPRVLAEFDAANVDELAARLGMLTVDFDVRPTANEARLLLRQKVAGALECAILNAPKRRDILQDWLAQQQWCIASETAALQPGRREEPPDAMFGVLGAFVQEMNDAAPAMIEQKNAERLAYDAAAIEAWREEAYADACEREVQQKAAAAQQADLVTRALEAADRNHADRLQAPRAGTATNSADAVPQAAPTRPAPHATPFTTSRLRPTAPHLRPLCVRLRQRRPTAPHPARRWHRRRPRYTRSTWARLPSTCMTMRRQCRDPSLARSHGGQMRKLPGRRQYGPWRRPCTQAKHRRAISRPAVAPRLTRCP